MHTSINYKRVYAGTPEMEQIQAFARSFDHEITPHPNINVYAHYRDDQLFGYSDHVFIPTVYPAFHPEFTRPRDVLRVMADWKMFCQLSGNVGYIAVPSNNDNGIGNFPEEVMQKIGLTKLNRELYWPE